MGWRSSRNVARSSGQHYFPSGKHYMPANTPGQHSLFIHVTWRALDQSRSRISDSDITTVDTTDITNVDTAVNWTGYCAFTHSVHTGTVDNSLVDATAPVVDVFGWTTLRATVWRQVSHSVVTTAGADTTVDTMKTSLSRASRVLLQSYLSSEHCDLLRPLRG